MGGCDFAWQKVMLSWAIATRAGCERDNDCEGRDEGAAVKPNVRCQVLRAAAALTCQVFKVVPVLLLPQG